MKSRALTIGLAVALICSQFVVFKYSRTIEHQKKTLKLYDETWGRLHYEISILERTQKSLVDVANQATNTAWAAIGVAREWKRYYEELEQRSNFKLKTDSTNAIDLYIGSGAGVPTGKHILYIELGNIVPPGNRKHLFVDFQKWDHQLKVDENIKNLRIVSGLKPTISLTNSSDGGAWAITFEKEIL